VKKYVSDRSMTPGSGESNAAIAGRSPAIGNDYAATAEMTSILAWKASPIDGWIDRTV
jgi:hypothetical protein